MSIRDKFNEFRKSVNTTIDKYNTPENRKKLADFSARMNSNMNSSFGGGAPRRKRSRDGNQRFSAADHSWDNALQGRWNGFDYDHTGRPKSKPKRGRGRDIHIHIKMDHERYY